MWLESDLYRLKTDKDSNLPFCEHAFVYYASNFKTFFLEENCLTQWQSKLMLQLLKIKISIRKDPGRIQFFTGLHNVLGFQY